ncbi:hypothetical protein JCM14720_16210 [Calditerricola yamamurae]
MTKQDDRTPQFNPIRLVLWSQTDVCQCLGRGTWRWNDGRLTCLWCGKPKYLDPQVNGESRWNST